MMCFFRYKIFKHKRAHVDTVQLIHRFAYLNWLNSVKHFCRKVYQKNYNLGISIFHLLRIVFFSLLTFLSVNYSCFSWFFLWLVSTFMHVWTYWYMWPNFGKSPLWARLKQLEFLSLPQPCWHHKTHFKYFYTFPCNLKHFYCIWTIPKQKIKFSSCFSELNI